MNHRSASQTSPGPWANWDSEHCSDTAQTLRSGTSVPNVTCVHDKEINRSVILPILLARWLAVSISLARVRDVWDSARFGLWRRLTLPRVPAGAGNPTSLLFSPLRAVEPERLRALDTRNVTSSRALADRAELIMREQFSAMSAHLAVENVTPAALRLRVQEAMRPMNRRALAPITASMRCVARPAVRAAVQGLPRP